MRHCAGRVRVYRNRAAQKGFGGNSEALTTQDSTESEGGALEHAYKVVLVFSALFKPNRPRRKVTSNCLYIF